MIIINAWYNYIKKYSIDNNNYLHDTALSTHATV